MVPPEPAVVPVPVTVRPPLDPVVFKMMPFVAPLAEMLRNVSPFEPMVVLATFRAVPVVVVKALPDPVTPTVPPPVAANAALVVVVRLSPPVKLIVVPVLLV